MKYLYKNIYICVFIVHISFIIFFSILTELFFTENGNYLEDNYKKNPFIYFIFIVFLAPIIEEFIFRFPLKFSYKNSFIAVIILIFLLLNNLLIYNFFFFLFFICIIIQMITKKTYNIIYLLSVICFSIIHLDNFYSINDSIIENILLIFPQLLLGIILTHIRIHKNIKSCVLYHSSYNLIILLIYIMVNKFYLGSFF